MGQKRRTLTGDTSSVQPEASAERKIESQGAFKSDVPFLCSTVGFGTHIFHAILTSYESCSLFFVFYVTFHIYYVEKAHNHGVPYIILLVCYKTLQNQ